MEHLGQRIGNMLLIHPLALLVVNGLDTSSAGDVIPASGHLQLRIMGKINRQLHQSLAIGSCTHDDRTVEILQGTTGNLACRSRFLIHQHHQWNHRIDGLHRCLVVVIGPAQLTAVRGHRNAPWHEDVHQVGSFQLTTATVVTEVEHQLLHALFLQVKKGAAHLLGTTLGKLCQADIANTVALHTVIRNRRCGTQRTTGNLHLHHLVRAGAPNLQCKGRSRLTSQMLPHILNTLAHHGRIINAQDDVTLAQSCFLGRCIPHRLINHRGLLLHVITNQRTYTPVLSREERFQLTGLRVIHRIRIQTL